MAYEVIEIPIGPSFSATAGKCQKLDEKVAF